MHFPLRKSYRMSHHRAEIVVMIAVMAYSEAPHLNSLINVVILTQILSMTESILKKQDELLKMTAINSESVYFAINIRSV